MSQDRDHGLEVVLQFEEALISGIFLLATGLHQARFGYKNVDELEHVTREYARAKLPMESMSAGKGINVWQYL